jgi:hypothetical protein
MKDTNQKDVASVASQITESPHGNLLNDLFARQRPAGWFFASPKSLEERKALADLEQLGVIVIEEGEFRTATSGRVKVSELIGRMTPLGLAVVKVLAHP